MAQSDSPADDTAIKQEDPSQPEVVMLLQNGEASSAKLYPAESNHHLSLDALRQPDVRFFVARDGGGRPLGTGAIVLKKGLAEIKRMWVEDDARGQGIASRILAALLEEACRAGAKAVQLETGASSHAALALYEKAGFKRRGPFADYRPDPLSVFMEKLL
jgi:putative acetyltransferase